MSKPQAHSSEPTGLYTGQQGLHTGVYHVRLAAACCTMRAKAAPALLLPACMLCLVLGVYISPMLLKLPGSHTSAPAALAVARGVELGRGATRPAYLAVGEPPGSCESAANPQPYLAGEQQSVATPQAARGWSGLPFRHIKIQSCYCLGSAFEVWLSKPWVGYTVADDGALGGCVLRLERRGAGDQGALYVL